MTRGPKFTIVGSGLGGALMAIYLGRQGHKVDLYEKRADPRSGKAGPGRSINLALSHRGLCALREVNLEGEVLKAAIPMNGRMMHALDGSLTFQPYGTSAEHANYSISRLALNAALVEAAGRFPGVGFFFESRCTGVDLEGPAIDVAGKEGNPPQRVACEAVLGSDGAYSAVRGQMQKLDRFEYTQEYLEHGYKELTLPPKPGGGFALDPNALHIWPRGTFMMIALPNPDETFTCTLFAPFEGPNSFAALRTEAEVVDFFQSIFPDAVPLMPGLGAEFLTNPIGSMVTVQCKPWHYEDKVVLIGDACHAVVPFYGQGMNAAFEDCLVLSESVGRHPGNLENAFREFQDLRKESLDALAKLAVDNFIEMRDKVSSPAFLMKKKLEHALHRVLPGAFIPLYMMVTYTRLSYAEAAARAARQDRWLGIAGAGLVFALGMVVAAFMG